MALLTRSDIENTLRRLGELAVQQDEAIELLVVGGAAMVLGYDARLATHDVDAICITAGVSAARPKPRLAGCKRVGLAV